MGQEIVYCYKCQRRIVGTEFAEGKAFQVTNHVSCSTCAVDLLQKLPPKEREQLLAKMFKATQERQPAPPPEPRPAKTPKPGTHRAVPARKAKAPKTALAIGAGFVAVAIVLLLALPGRRPPPPPPAAPLVQRPAPKPAPPPLHEAAKEAVRRAKDFAAAFPGKLDGQVDAWQRAVERTEDTPYAEEARAGLSAVLARRRQAIDQDWAELDQRARALETKQDFEAAIDLLQSARGRHTAPEWTLTLDRRVGEMRGVVAARSAPPPPANVVVPPVPPPGPERPAAVIFSAHPSSFKGKSGGAAEVVEAAVAVPPAGVSIGGFRVVPKPATTVRFRVKSTVDLDVFECISWIQSKNANAWSHVMNLKKGEWRSVEFKLGDMRFNWNGDPIRDAPVDGMAFYFLNRPDDSRVLLKDFEILD